MSNHLAVATVTAVLQNNLQAVLDAEVSSLNARVAHVRPNAQVADLPATGINLFLFQITPNAAARNVDLPTRRADGTFINRPTVALDLHYLLSFYGDDAKFEPQILLGCAVRALHAQPVLTREAIQHTLDMTIPSNVNLFSFVAGSDLADAIDLVRFTPTALTLEEMSKLWSVFFQVPYVLSVAYQASVVLIDRDIPVAAPLRVRVPANVYVQQLRTPVIAQVLSQASAAAPIVAGQPIFTGYIVVLAGTMLQGASTVVQIDGAEALATVTDTQVSVPLPAALLAGTHSVQIIQQLAMGNPAVPHDVIASNVAAFVLQPKVTATATASAVTLNVTPPVGKRQRVQLLLNQLVAPGTTPATYSFEALSRDVSGAPDQTATLDVPISGVVAGTYLVRVRVDGAESVLDVDAAGTYNAPSVVIP